MVCCSFLRRLWREEPWGYPERPQVAILSLKFPAGVKKPVLTRLYRLLFAVGWTFWIIWSAVGTDGNPRPEWCIYVTHWTAAVMGGYVWAALLSTLLPHVRWLDAAAWFLHSIAAPLTVMVTVLYWSTYEPPADSTSKDLPSNPTTVHMHGINALLMFMDLALARYPYQLKHFLAPLGFILSYLAFNFAYWRETGVVVYGALDYSKPVGAGIMIAMTILGLFPLVHLIMWRYELAWFALSERRRYAAAAQTSLERKIQDVEAGPVKATAHGAPRPPLSLSDAVLATRRVPSMEEAGGKLQTPSTAGTGLEMSGTGDDMDMEPSPAAAAAVATAF